MNKKIILTFCGITPLYVFASQYVSIISKENEYLMGGRVESIEYTPWINDGASYCSTDIKEEDVYFNKTAIQIEECKQNQKRDKNIYYIEVDGSKTLKSSVEESKTILLSSTEKSITGIHLESDCNNILKNGFSDGDGIYHIKPSLNNFDVYCDMTNDDGGWTRLIHNQAVFNTNNYVNEINAIFGSGEDKVLKYYETGTGSTMYYKRITSYSSNFYLNVLETFRNTQNLLNIDFKMNHNYQNLKKDINNFSYCNYSNEPVPEHTYVGFPRDCGQNEAIGGRWLSMANSRGYNPWTSYNHNYTLWIK
jgi:hypothetical protein